MKVVQSIVDLNPSYGRAWVFLFCKSDYFPRTDIQFTIPKSVKPLKFGQAWLTIKAHLERIGFDFGTIPLEYGGPADKLREFGLLAAPPPPMIEIVESNLWDDGMTYTLNVSLRLKEHRVRGWASIGLPFPASEIEANLDTLKEKLLLHGFTFRADGRIRLPRSASDTFLSVDTSTAP